MTQRDDTLLACPFALLVALAGCAAVPPYGTFLRGHAQAQYVIAKDAAEKLVSAYPPENHSIRLERQADDVFGERLANELRKRGYSLHEGTAPGTPREVTVRYVLDLLKRTDLLRLSLYLPRRRLSRPYAQRSGQVLPNGPWCLEVQDD